MASTLEKTHMCLTKDDVKWLNGDQNVSNSKQYEPNKPSESNLQLKHPLGFLGFLDKISRHKLGLNLTVRKLHALKEEALSHEAFTLTERSEGFRECLKSHSQQNKKMWHEMILVNDYVDVFTAKDMTSAIRGSRKLQSCALSLGCNSDIASHVPKNFQINREFQDDLKISVNLGNGESTKSIVEGRNKLWGREFPSNQQNLSRIIPNEFWDKTTEIPTEFKDSFWTIQQIISSSQRIFERERKRNNQPTSIKTLLCVLKWAQLLVDVWQYEDPKEIKESLWEREDWLESLTSPCSETPSDFDSLCFMLRPYFTSALCLDVQSFLDGFIIDVDEPEKEMGVGGKETKKFLTLAKIFLATFFTGKVLGLNSSQSKSLVQKNGSLFGDTFEKDVFMKIKEKMENLPWATTFCGEQGQKEVDFLVFLGHTKTVLYVNCVATLSLKSALNIKDQSDNTFNYIQKHLPLKEGWRFLPWVCFEEQTNVSICRHCQHFSLLKVSKLDEALDKILQDNKMDLIDDETQKEYEALIKTHLFYMLMNKQGFEGAKEAKHQLGMGDLPSQPIHFWNLKQLRILQRDQKRMIIQSQGLFGTGKTEILKTKAIKLAKDKENRVAFLVATTRHSRDFGELLLAKYLKFQFKSHKNVKVSDLTDTQEIQELLLKMFQKCPPCNIHLFIDGTSTKLMDQIQTYLTNTPHDSDNFIWIVDKSDGFTSHFARDIHGFEIEKDLVLNMRNSQDIQKHIAFIYEYQKEEPPKPKSKKIYIKRLIFELQQEQEVKQVLIILQDPLYRFGNFERHEIDNVKYYGFEHRKSCSDPDLDQFFEAPNNEERHILITREDFVDGFEAQMVLVEEYYNVSKSSTLFCAKIRLKSASHNANSHIEKQKLFSNLPKPEGKTNHKPCNQDFERFSLEHYSQLQSESCASSLRYWDGRYNIRDLNWQHIRKRAWSITQYNLIPQHFNKFEVPLLLRLQISQISDEKKTDCFIGLKGNVFRGKHRLTSLVNCWDTVSKVELVLHKQVQTWTTWMNVLIAEIIHSHRRNVELNPNFDFHRLFSIWHRIRKEFLNQQVIPHQWIIHDHFYDQLRMNMLQNCVKYRPECHKVQSILESFVIDPKFTHWSLIEDLLEWLNTRNCQTVEKFFVNWEIPETKTKSSKNKLTELRKELKKVLIYPFEPSESSHLSLPFISVIWQHKIFRVWRKTLQKNFPLVDEQLFFQSIVSAEKESEDKIDMMIKTRGSSSIFRQPQEEVANYDGVRLSRIIGDNTALANAAIFIASHVERPTEM